MTKTEKSMKKHSLIFVLLFYFVKIFGINTYTLSKSNQLKRSYISIIYVIFLLTVYVYSTFIFVIDRKNALLPGETPLSMIMDCIGIAIGFFEMVFGLLLFLVSKNRIKSFLKSLRKIDKVEIQLKMKDDDYEKHFYRLAISLTIFDCFCLLRNNSNPQAFQSNDIHIILWIWYGVLGLIPSNTVILFVWIVAIVQEKFYRLNAKIRSYTSNDYVGRCCNETNGASFDQNLSYLFSQKIDMISRLHRELRHAIHLIEEHFALLILLNSVKHLLSFTSSIHITYRYLKNREYYTWDDLIYTLHTSTWVATPVLIMRAISNVCGSTINEANDTGNLLHALLNDCQLCDDYRKLAKLEIAFLDLLQNKTEICLLGFVDVNCFLVYSIIATAAGYLTIMLQFYD